MLSESNIEPALREIAGWKVFDANVRVGHSGVHGQLALNPPELVAEMDRFGIERALVAHFAAEEYDAAEGNGALAEAVACAPERFVAAWAALPDAASVAALARRNPKAVRLSFGALQHNFSPSRWCSSELFEYLEASSTLALIERRSIEWDVLDAVLTGFPRLNVLLLETGYRADRYLRPLLRRHKNLYFESSTLAAYRQLETFVDDCGPDRLVFGSRLPLYTPGAALAVLATARIAEGARMAIAGGTLRRLIAGGAA